MINVKQASIFLIALLAVIPIKSFAISDEYSLKIANYGDAVLECSVYYQFVHEGLKTNPNTTEAELKKVFETHDVLFTGAVLLLQLAGVSDKAIEAKAQLAANNMSEDGSGLNAAVVILEYSDKCKQLGDDYDTTVRELLKPIAEGR